MKRLGYWAVAFLFALGVSLYLNRERLRIYFEQIDEKRQNDELMRKAEADRAKLLEERARVDSPLGMEEKAREMGLRKKGEEGL
ncbi:MAG: hypothetical protein AKCLJLPJ_01916 [Fimbriimonadales bacterium]|nr:hypothetical protein [Fimbriimonadales bacterium]